MKTISINSILIALDYDPTAKYVAETGFALAKNPGASIVLLHVISDPSLYFSGGHIVVIGFAGHPEIIPEEPDNNAALNKAALLFLEKTRLYLGDPSIQLLVKEGDVAGTILMVADDLHSDIIVMGIHSRKRIGNVLMGSTAEKLLQQTTRPVIIVPTR